MDVTDGRGRGAVGATGVPVATAAVDGGGDTDALGPLLPHAARDRHNTDPRTRRTLNLSPPHKFG